MARDWFHSLSEDMSRWHGPFYSEEIAIWDGEDIAINAGADSFWVAQLCNRTDQWTNKLELTVPEELRATHYREGNTASDS